MDYDLSLEIIIVYPEIILIIVRDRLIEIGVMRLWICYKGGCWFVGVASALRNLSVFIRSLYMWIRWVLVGSILQGEASPTNIGYNSTRAKKDE
jgi:hypothetical protein